MTREQCEGCSYSVLNKKSLICNINIYVKPNSADIRESILKNKKCGHHEEG
jgi:hypothetical protein